MIAIERAERTNESRREENGRQWKIIERERGKKLINGCLSDMNVKC